MNHSVRAARFVRHAAAIPVLAALLQLLPLAGPAAADGPQSKLLISSMPKPAMVFVDGEPKGETVLSVDVPPGRHDVRAEKPGYQPAHLAVELQPGEVRSVTLALQRSAAGEYEITLFTPDSRPFSDQDLRLLAELEGRGFRIDRRNYPSNPDANIKVSKGERALAEQVLGVLARHYPTTFTIREIFPPGEKDVFINLGTGTALAQVGPAPTEGGPAFVVAQAQPPAAGLPAEAPPQFDAEHARHEITLFTPERRAFTATDERMLAAFERMGFRVDRENRRSNPEANIKIGKGKKQLAQKVLAVVARYYTGPFEIKEIFAEDSPDIFINLGPASEVPPQVSSNPADHNIVIFTPQDRAFNAADQQLIAELRRRGFNVQDNPGGGGSNPDSNVKVGRGNQAMGEQVQELMRRCYDQPFDVRDIFEPGDTDIYVNLGQGAVPRPSCGGPAASSAGGLDRSAFRVVVFTPRGRSFEAADRKLIADLRALNFQVQEEPGAGGSNPDSNIKVARGNAGMGSLVQSLVRQCYDQPLTILEAFEPDTPNIFVNLGDVATPRPECGSAAAPTARSSGPAGGPGLHRRDYYEVTLFTPNSRPYTATDRQMMEDLARRGYRVDLTPLGSNPTANIKVGRGERALAEEIQGILGTYYRQSFEILEIFDAGDADVFINLGLEDSSSPHAAGGASGEYGDYRLRFFTPRARKLTERETKLGNELRAMGFRVEDQPLRSAEAASIKFGLDRREVAIVVQRLLEEQLGHTFELRPVFDPGDTDVFIDLGPDDGSKAGEPAAARPAQEQPAPQVAGPGYFKVTIFTPDSRPLNGSDQRIIGILKEKGFQVVEDRPGGGGTNAQPNVKVGKGFGRFGMMVLEAVRSCYDQPFELLEVFEPGDSDIYINLGTEADSKARCGKTRL